ncbi:CapA family protein [Nannocystis bainbridge]|uniref:CapA family protein n=1 Tax=Nannocystis bainbridge TaxID=2995303 RepID=A0ABT5E9Y4_9BACT|nr:CapA family protein [Nannocystis bainbridge]MDC0722263.1 CapA family protein [Nannocystis bainbridge]
MAQPTAPAVAPAPVPEDSNEAAGRRFEEPVPEDRSAEEAEPAKVEPAVTREPLEITFVGDIIFGRYRASAFDPIVGEGERPFDDIFETMKSDLLVGNLETPLVYELPVKSPIGARFAFGASKAMAQHLVDGGFAALSLANNHSFDQRTDGLLQSPKILEELGIVPLGASRSEPPIFRVEAFERRGWKIGLLAVTSRRNAPQFPDTPELPFLSTNDFEATLGPVIDAARASHDLIIVFVHWGEEYADAPGAHQQRQARALLDRGADLVVGHHPHVLQAIEQYGKKAIAYSLGNFLFENTHEVPRLTGVLRARFSGNSCLETLTFHPAYIKRTPSKHPVPATKGMGKTVRARMSTLSEAQGTKLEASGEDLVLRGDCASGG